VYHEPARSYVTAWALFGLLLVGYVLDLAFGGGLPHTWGWLLAVVLVVGIDVLATHAARVRRSITVTPTELRVGEHALPCESIIAIVDVDPSLPVLGQAVREGLSRGTPGLAVRLVGGDVLVVPTRHPDRLAAALDVSFELPVIRIAEPDELAAVPEIERRAEVLFRVAGIHLPPGWTTVDELHQAKAVFVVGRPPVGVVQVEEVDAVAHVDLLAVLPGRMREGLGTALLEAACSWAAAGGYPAITIITFADVAWNAPFYAARGFAVIDDITPELVELRDWERAVGLDTLGRRVVMRREL
jgi:GNAT superfamily N-acetyltransferase